MMPTDSTSSSRPRSEREPTSFFTYAFARDAPRSVPSAGPVPLFVELSPRANRALCKGAAAVGLSPEAFLSRVVLRLCREGEWEGPPEARGPDERAGRGEATRVLRRVPLRRPDRHRLCQRAAALSSAPSILVERVVLRLHDQIEAAGIDGEASRRPVAAYRLLVRLLHSRDATAPGDATTTPTA